MMKSAYERAMERMEAESGPAKKLSDGEKERIAEIDKRHNANIAELKLAYDAKLASAPYDEAQALQQELTSELATLEQKYEEAKDDIWGSTGE